MTVSGFTDTTEDRCALCLGCHKAKTTDEQCVDSSPQHCIQIIYHEIIYHEIIYHEIIYHSDNLP
jgi:hypothetical protein